ncbi:MAG TPA: PAS domain S-box protein [Streptosporangiaceae bacterium]|nr:PAS domain S-box protein [Streptosporangiaceae bacterium]
MARSSAARAADPRRIGQGPARGSRTDSAELAELRAQLREAYETIEAIRGGGVDSLMVGPPGQEQVYALATADRPYRLIVEAMSEGAATVSPRGVILDANPRLGSMTGRTAAELLGTAVLDLVPRAQRAALARLMDVRAGDSDRGEVELRGPAGTTIPVLMAASGFDLDGTLMRCLVLTDLTAQRAAEDQAADAAKALRESEAQLRAIFENVPVGIAEKTPGLDILRVNPYYCHMLGYSADELRGQMARDFIDPDDRCDEARGIEQLLSGEIQTFRQVKRFIRKNGEIGWVDSSQILVRDSDGNPLRFILAGGDITAQEKASQYARSLIEASLDPIVTISPDGTITDLNAATELATGYGKDELLGSDFCQHFSDPGLALAGYEQAFQNGSVRDFALELRHRDGHLTPVLYNASVYRDPAGRVLGVVAAARDVTQIRRAQEELRASEEHFRGIFESAPVSIADVAPAGQIVRANPAMCAVTGYTAGELCSIRERDIVHPDDLDAELARSRRLRSGEIDSYSAEVRYRRKNGEVVWLDVGRAVVRRRDGDLLMFVSVGRDITAQRHAEAEVRTLNAELEARVEQRTAELKRANKNLEAFTYSVAHDLRTPLRALSGFSEALLEDYSGRLDETGRGYATRIQAASEQMAALIDDLLQLSRVSRAGMRPGPVDLSSEFAAIAGKLRSREPGRRVRIRVQDGVRVTADRVLIRTVLQNLAENAWKFTARRDDATIDFGTAAVDGAGICYYVRDNGAGFDPAYAGKLFQPFQRLHAGTDFPGTGIGLATVQRIIERHGGRTWAEGAVDSGATVYFTLGGPDAR